MERFGSHKLIIILKMVLKSFGELVHTALDSRSKWVLMGFGDSVKYWYVNLLATQ